MNPAAARTEISQLRAEVARLQAELENARLAQGMGGAGTGGSGAEGTSERVPVASAELNGRVSDVSRKRVHVIDSETGNTYVLRVDEDTRARRGDKRIRVQSLREGSQVRASFDLVAGETYATEITELPAKQRARGSKANRK
jgi:hypothetical protein